jgi:hypothetical protein
MAKIAPQLPIEVDSETGVWTTDALPMLYVPRHFFVNNHMGIEEVLGADAYAEILYKAGYKSAWHWCEKEAECHGLEGVAVFEHYMKRLSQRGWGLFKIQDIDLDKGTASVKLEALGVRLRLRQGRPQGRLHVHRLVRRRHGPDSRRPRQQDPHRGRTGLRRLGRRPRRWPVRQAVVSRR